MVFTGRLHQLQFYGKFPLMDKMFAPLYFPHPLHCEPEARYLPVHLICENNLFSFPDVLFLTHLHKCVRDTHTHTLQMFLLLNAEFYRVGHADELAINYIIFAD